MQLYANLRSRLSKIAFILMVCTSIAACSSGGGNDDPPPSDPPQNTPANTAPVAHAGQDVTPFVGDTVTLDGSLSNDPDGESISYLWQFTSLPSGSQSSLSTQSAATPSFIPDLPGTYVISLVVNDGQDNSQADTVFVMAQEIPVPVNNPPLAMAGDDQLVTSGTQIQLDGTASSDPDGDSVTYAWSLISIPAGSNASLSTTTSGTPTFDADVAGSYLVQLIVNDGQIDSEPDHVLVAADLGDFTGNSYSLSSAKFGITTGHYNNDNNVDLAVAVYDNTAPPGVFLGAIGVLLGDGNGGLAAPTYFSAGDSPPRQIISRDINNDQILDLIGVNTGYADAHGSTISVLLGNGGGDFSANTEFTVSEEPWDIVAAHFNEDNNLDLAVSSFSSGTTILFGDGSGSFPNTTDPTAIGSGTSITLGDTNSDTILDLIISQNGAHNIALYSGDGLGGFEALPRIRSNGIFVSTVGDFNGDSYLDVVSARKSYDTSTNTDYLSLYTGNGTGNFSTGTDYPAGFSVTRMETADFNKDGFLDVAMASFGNSQLTVVFGDGAGGFFNVKSYQMTGSLFDLTIADFNNDGYDDIAVADPVKITIYLWTP